MSMSPKVIRIFKPSIDDTIDPNVIRGIIDLKSIPGLKVDHSYQRERLAPAARKQITMALESNKLLPDIELGMRGDHFWMDDPLTLVDLQDPVFIIDGYQRVSTVTEHLERFPGENIRLGAVIHFNTTQRMERERFQALNLFRAKMAPSLLLRNCKEENHLMAQLYGLSKNNGKEVMYGKVCWSQNMSQGELTTGLTYCQVALLLHSHLGSFSNITTKEIPESLNRLEKITGLPLFRGNITAFWEFIDATWGVKTINRRGALHFKAPFMRTLTRIVADHTDFWSGARLTIPGEIRRKLARLPMSDPEVARLAGASGKAVESLYYMLVRHINSGKRTKRITNRYGNIIVPMPIISDDSEDEDEDVG